MKFLLFPCFSKEKLKRVTRVMKRSVITINTFFLKNKKKRENSYEAFQIRMKKFQIRWNLYFANIFRFIFFFFIKYELKTMKKNVNIYIY